MEKCLFDFDLRCVAGKKCQNFWGYDEDLKGSLEYNLFPCFLLGLLHHKF